jgi:hypothetical protein
MPAAAGAGLSKLDIKLLLNHALTVTDVTDGYIHNTAQAITFGSARKS